MSTPRPRRATALLLAGALAIPALAYAIRGGADGVHSQQARSLTLAWRPGERHVYSLDWRVGDRVALGSLVAGQAPLEGLLRLKGDLVLEGLGASRDGYRLSARLERLEEQRLEVLGHDALAEGEQLVGERALVTISQTGAVSRVDFPRGTPALFRHTMTGLLRELGLTLPAGSQTQWSTAERGARGEGSVQYRRSADEPETLVRSREGYRALDALPGPLFAGTRQTVHAEATLRLDPAGHLASLEGHERLTILSATGEVVLSGTSDLVLVERERNVIEAVLPDPEVASFEGEDGAYAERARLREQAGDLTLAQVEDRARQLAMGRPLPEGWFRQAGAFVRLHPESAKELLALFQEKELNAPARAAVLDVLTHAGSGPAQEALRRALDTQVAREDPKSFPSYLQRLSFVPHPEAATVDWLEREYRTANRSGRAHDARASAYAIGAVAGTLASSADASPEELQATGRAMARLRGDLRDAGDPEDKAVFLAALGNAGLAEDVPTLVAFTTDPDPGLRERAADALRKRTDDEARGALLELLEDPEAEVRSTAVRILRARAEGDPEIAAALAQTS